MSLIPPRGGRPSEAQSIAESSTSAHSDPLQPQHELRKSRSSMFTNLLKRSRSKPRLRADSGRLGADLPGAAQTTSPYASGTLPFFPNSSPPSPTIAKSKKEKVRGKKKSSNRPPPLPPKDLIEPEIKLDTNIDDMNGIVSLQMLAGPLDAGTSGSGFEECQSSVSHSDGGFPASPTSSIFSNPFPFLPPHVAAMRPYVALDHRKVSPKTIIAPPTGPIPAGASWTAPESWSVEREGEDLDDPGYSSSDSSILGGARPSSMSLGYPRRKGRRRTMKPSKPPLGYQSYKIRIYRANTSFHVASIGLTVTVAELAPVLNQKLLPDTERETHRLYLKERGGRGKCLFNRLSLHVLTFYQNESWHRLRDRQTYFEDGWNNVVMTASMALKLSELETFLFFSSLSIRVSYWDQRYVPKYLHVSVSYSTRRRRNCH